MRRTNAHIVRSLQRHANCVNQHGQCCTLISHIGESNACTIADYGKDRYGGRIERKNHSGYVLCNKREYEDGATLVIRHGGEIKNHHVLFLVPQ